MRAVIVIATGLAFLFLAVLPAQAQSCCGSGIAYHADCGSGCGRIIIYTCDEGNGNSYYAPANAQCGGCNIIGEYIPSGNCYDGAVSALSLVLHDAADTGGEILIYVNAYVRDCAGKYAPERMPMARQAS